MLYLLLAAVLCGADQLFKHWVSGTIPLGGTMDLIPGVLGLTHVRNTGMAFSMLSKHTWLLALVSAVVAAGLVWLLLRGKFTRWEKVCLALILGGAVGNLIDRALLGYVVDMFQTLFVRFAVFNLADSFIDVGAVVFCVLYLARTVREDREKKAAAAIEDKAEDKPEDASSDKPEDDAHESGADGN